MSYINANDDVLFNILRDCKTLPSFLDVVFGFLRRRTDFYVEATDSQSSVGLPPGFAENYVKQAFFKWKPRNKHNLEILPENLIPSVAEESEIVTSNTEEQVCDEPSISPNVNQDFITPRLENSDFLLSEHYNGVAYETYAWSQSITDIDIVVKVPEGVTIKDLCVEISSQKLHIFLKNDGKVLLSGCLCQKVKHNEVLWALDKRKLNIHLDKVKEMWWEYLLEGEKKIDVSKIDCSRPFEDLPEDAQAKIEELAWNQERMIQGLPTSQEMAIEDTLKKAWNVEGSPFSGDFDMNKVKIN